MNTTEYFVWTTKRHVTRAQEAKIDKAVKAIDPNMDFTRYYAAGNDTHGWLSRPNDGTNDYNDRRLDNAKCIEIARQILGAE